MKITKCKNHVYVSVNTDFIINIWKTLTLGIIAWEKKVQHLLFKKKKKMTIFVLLKLFTFSSECSKIN